MSYDKTKKALENVIKKPQLTDQLLSRPPFKFIVDIVSNVIDSTGYLKNEFSSEELSAAGEDKNSKTAFLEKLLKVLDDGTLKSVKASKIISGKDAEETNKMLQLLGTNATKFTAKETPGVKRKKSKDRDKTSEKSKKETDNELKSDKKEKSKDVDTKKEEKKKKSSTSKERKSSDKKSKKDNNDDKTTGEKTKKSKKVHTERSLKRADSMIAINGDAPSTPNNDKENPQDEGYDDQELIEPPALFNRDEVDLNGKQTWLGPPAHPAAKADSSRIDENSQLLRKDDSISSFRPTTGAGNRPMTSMGRPGTAASRPAPPKLKKKQIGTIEATPLAAVEFKSEIINEQSVPEKEDDNSFIIDHEEDVEDTLRPNSAIDAVDEQDRGTLVQKIMDTRTEIEDGVAIDQPLETEADRQISLEKEKTKILQIKLQDLTKSAYPLARLFDFANDDIESMVKELERWRNEHRKIELEEQNKKSSGFGDSSRLYNIIANLQKEIHEIKEELANARGRVLKNEKRIRHFVSNL